MEHRSFNGCLKDIMIILPSIYNNIIAFMKYEGWNFNSGNYLFTTDTK